jgi:hypothetical protein
LALGREETALSYSREEDDYLGIPNEKIPMEILDPTKTLYLFMMRL